MVATEQRSTWAFKPRRYMDSVDFGPALEALDWAAAHKDAITHIVTREQAADEPWPDD